MSDFCLHALAYMTRQPLEVLRKKKQSELSWLLLRQLQARPWLLVLDGLERVLVAYHRYDAAQVADEDAGISDEIARRDPSAAIRPQDDELLRELAGADPSKILITSRIAPRALLNQAGQVLPGVLHARLPGLRPADAEALVRACGLRGDSGLIQDYLQRHCNCHPRVTGIVAGLVNDYLPDRGNFDGWATDPRHGGQLNLAELNLVQKRNHILRWAIESLPDTSRQLLSALALLSGAIDYDTLVALNPHLPPGPEIPSETERPKDMRRWTHISGIVRRAALRGYKSTGQRFTEYEQNGRSRLEATERQAAVRKLADTVRDLERRGLLQYDRQANRYDLHPVVRGFVSGGLRPEDRDRFGQRAVDYFSQRAHDPYELAETLDDVRYGLQVVRTLLHMGRLREAYEAYFDGLSETLVYNLEAGAEILSLLRPFFDQGWTSLNGNLDDFANSLLANSVANGFSLLGELGNSLLLNELSLRIVLRMKLWGNARMSLSNLALDYARQNRIADSDKCGLLELAIAEQLTSVEDGVNLFVARLNRFNLLTMMGRYEEAEETWHALDQMGRRWPRSFYRSGAAEALFAQFQFQRRCLTEGQLDHAEQLAQASRNRASVRFLHGLRGAWLLERQEWLPAAETLREAIRMTREAGMTDARLEAQLALAQLRCGELVAPRQEAVRLSRDPHAYLELAELWHAIGNPERATEHALAAYQWAWADGPPYVHAYELDRAVTLLKKLGATIPPLPAHDPATERPLAFEAEVLAAVQRLRRGRKELE